MALKRDDRNHPVLHTEHFQTAPNSEQVVTSQFLIQNQPTAKEVLKKRTFFLIGDLSRSQ